MEEGLEELEGKMRRNIVKAKGYDSLARPCLHTHSSQIMVIYDTHPAQMSESHRREGKLLALSHRASVQFLDHQGPETDMGPPCEVS